MVGGIVGKTVRLLLQPLYFLGRPVLTISLKTLNGIEKLESYHGLKRI